MTFLRRVEYLGVATTNLAFHELDIPLRHPVNTKTVRHDRPRIVSPVNA